jgi:CheY-like chemotaxis protein
MTVNNPSNKIIILVVEDDDISYFLIQEILSSIGMKAVRATSKTEVLNLVGSQDDFQMIIMDVILNGSENGYAIASELASMHVDLPIMIVSAWATAVLEPDRSKIKNIKQVMDKPFNVESFKRILLKTLQG